MYAKPLNLYFKGPYSGSGSEIKIRRCLFTFSIKQEIRHFHVVIVKKRQRNVQKKRKLLFCLLNLLFFLDVLVAVVSSNLLKRNSRRHLILQRVFVVTTETSYQMLEVLFILRSRVGLTSFNKNNPVNFSGERIKRSFLLCFFLETRNNFKSSQISTTLSSSSTNLKVSSVKRNSNNFFLLLCKYTLDTKRITHLRRMLTDDKDKERTEDMQLVTNVQDQMPRRPAHLHATD